MIRNMRTLHPRGAAVPGICVDAEGATIGPDCILVGRTSHGYRAIDREGASELQKCLFDATPDQDWLFRQCQRIASALDKGEVALAQIYGLHIPIDELDDHQLRRVALAKGGFNPDEPRIPRGDPHGGEWTTDGGLTEVPASTNVFADFAGAGGDGSGITWQIRPLPPTSPTTPSASDSPSPPNGDSNDEGSDGLPELAGDDAVYSDYDSEADPLIDAAYPGVYHNWVVGQVAEQLRARGAIVITEVDLIAKNGATARADIVAILLPGTPPVIVEVKTGLDPTYTPGQQVIYPMAQVGDHVYSPNAKIQSLGFSPGQWLPAMVFITVYKKNPQSEFEWMRNPYPLIP